MSVSTVSFPALFSSVFPRVRRSTFFVLPAACAFVLSGCGVGAFSSTTPLPSMSPAEQLRDQVARHEAGVVARAQELAAKSAGCAKCRQVAGEVARGASGRLDTLGGLWVPWPADLAQSADVERPFPVAEPPLLPAEFAAWMMATAEHDLHVIAESSVDEHQRPLLFASAMSRMVAALRVADAFGVSFDDDTVTRLRAGVRGGVSDFEVRSWASWWDDEHHADEHELHAHGEHVQSVDAAHDVHSVDGAAAAAAVTAWDCAAQMLPGLGAQEDRVDFANERANVLLARSTAVLAAGVADERVARCSVEDASFSSLAASVLAADLQLLMSGDEELSERAHAFIEDDVRTWFSEVSEEDLAELVSVRDAHEHE